MARPLGCVAMVAPRRNSPIADIGRFRPKAIARALLRRWALLPFLPYPDIRRDRLGSVDGMDTSARFG